MKKVIFLCGMYGGKRDIFLFKKILKNSEVIYFPYDTKLKDSFENLAKKLDNFIKKLNIKKNEKISLVGLSAGGIIIDYYLKFLNNQKVNKAAIICSPIKGTYLANLFSKKRKGINQISKNSLFIKKINNKKITNVKIKSYWSYFDPIVPGTSAKYKDSEHTFFPLHWIIQFWPPLVYKIKSFLED